MRNVLLIWLICEKPRKTFAGMPTTIHQIAIELIGMRKEQINKY